MYRIARTPLELLRIPLYVWKFYGTFDIDLIALQKLHKAYAVCQQGAFVYIGCMIQSLALLNSTSMKQVIQIIFIAVSYINAAVKTLIVYINRKKLQKLWAELQSSDYTAKNEMEQQ